MLGCLMESSLLLCWEHPFINYSRRCRLRITTDEDTVHLIELFSEILNFCLDILQPPGIVP